MTVRLGSDGGIILEGICPVEDAEALLSLLLGNPDPHLVWDGCDLAHTAIIQVLMAAQPTMHGPPKSAFLGKWFGQGLGDPTGPSATSSTWP
jgi:hypothetical protein